MLLIESERNNKIMASKYFVGIDVGTNETKGILIDEQGREVVSASTTHGVDNPKPNYFEHDADKVWYKDICIISQKLLNQSKVNPEDIKCIGVSALSSDCLPVDIHGKPLRKAILYGIDARAMAECQELTDKWGENKVIELFGRPLGASDIAGYITDEASKDTGLAIGTAVITGGDDSGAEAISSGVMAPGDMLIQMGSTAYMILCTDKLYDDERLWREEFIVPYTYDVSAGTNTSGALTKWIRDTFYLDKVHEQEQGGINAYQAMMHMNLYVIRLNITLKFLRSYKFLLIRSW